MAPKAGTYKMECWGAMGSGYDPIAGGKGGYASGSIILNKSTNLYVYVGQKAPLTAYSSGEGVIASGGWNGGGYGVMCSAQQGRGGGGATDIRLTAASTSDYSVWNNASSLRTRIIVAAGGGGVGSYGFSGTQGDAGGVNGYSGTDNYSDSQPDGFYGTGGHQTTGGVVGRGWSPHVEGPNYIIPNHLNDGSFGKGGDDRGWAYIHDYGDGGANNRGGSGGGGGWYGGGAAYRGHAGSGGGSSFISGHKGCSGYNNTSNGHTGIGNSSVINGKAYTFSDPKIYDGKGYLWSNVAASSATGTRGFPATTTGSENGHASDGYCRISYIPN